MSSPSAKNLPSFFAAPRCLNFITCSDKIILRRRTKSIVIDQENATGSGEFSCRLEEETFAKVTELSCSVNVSQPMKYRVIQS